MLDAVRQHASTKVEQTDLSSASRLAASYGRADFGDAFSIELPESASRDAEDLARHIFAQPAEWVVMLVGLRDTLVWPLGLKRAVDLAAEGGDRINIFRVFERYDGEIILGEDDIHLNFRVSVLVQPASDGRLRRLIVTTLVFHNRLLGRAYFALIAPFHRAVVRASLDKAQRRGWPIR
ncbi:DUF2867 domain-containing protein [Paraburkholderia fynbosensis]|uniref:DUF2867 domain-containing protein n=1 Tax=Paraburkholderia fynbosensis TaxID=1200993 RepID=UPI00158277C4|nr:DUF2867 domain-containing protein [Paraburkholderia fynbosensis]